MHPQSVLGLSLKLKFLLGQWCDCHIKMAIMNADGLIPKFPGNLDIFLQHICKLRNAAGTYEVDGPTYRIF